MIFQPEQRCERLTPGLERRCSGSSGDSVPCPGSRAHGAEAPSGRAGMGLSEEEPRVCLWLVTAQRRWQCLWGSATSRPDAGCAGLRLRDFTEQDAENPAVLTALKTKEGHPENTCSRLNVNNERTHLVKKMIVMFKTNFSSQ